MVVILYVENVSEAVARIMRKHNVTVAMKPYKTLKTVLVHPKDKQEKEDLTNPLSPTTQLKRTMS